MAKKLKSPCHFTYSQLSCKWPHLVHDKVVAQRLRKVVARVSAVLGGNREAKKGGFFYFPGRRPPSWPELPCDSQKNETLGVKNTLSLQCYILSLRRKPPKPPIRFFSRVKRLQLVLQCFAFWLVYRFLCLLWLVKVCTLYFCFDSKQPKSTNHKRRRQYHEPITPTACFQRKKIRSYWWRKWRET